ncbi:MAG: site-2 protease family protein [Firmicutes bacterium]|nr:site-2 protease family protein [Bacillota bacterium]
MFSADFRTLILAVPAVLFAISIHEFGHGLAATWLGDPTPRVQGRLTLNPLAHLDIMGALMFILFRFGWAKPVMVNPYNLRPGPKKGMLLVGIAGPAANFITAWVCTLLWRHWPTMLFPFNVSMVAVTFLQINVIYNLSLAAFNLIPIPPLDGSKILFGFLPRRFYPVAVWLEQYGFFVLLLLLVTGMVGRLFLPIVSLLQRLLFYLT